MIEDDGTRVAATDGVLGGLPEFLILLAKGRAVEGARQIPITR